MGLNSHSSSVGSFHSYGSLQDTCQQRCSQRQPTSRHAYSHRCRDSYKNMFPPALILLTPCLACKQAARCKPYTCRQRPLPLTTRHIRSRKG